MSDAGVWAVAGHGGRVRFEILGYENREAEDRSDANWLRVAFDLDVGGCSFRRTASLTTDDLAVFTRELSEALSSLRGSVVLHADEEWLHLLVAFQSRGAVDIRGRVTNEALNVTIDFRLDSDQSFLTQTLSDLRDVTRAWPVVD